MIRETVNWLKSVYSVPSAEVLALRELENAKRSLLEAQSTREYADSMCKYHEARIKYHEARIKRLAAYLRTATEAKQ